MSIPAHNDDHDHGAPMTPSANAILTPDVDFNGIEDESLDIVDTPAASTPKRRLNLALSVALLVVGGVVGALLLTMQPSTPTASSISVGGGNGQVSVCYDSWDSWGPGKMADQFRRIKERFSGVRTYQTRGARNHIEVAAEVGLSIYAGVWIKDGGWEADMQAAVDGARRFPNSIKAILVGNEEILEGKDQWFVIDKVNRMKSMLQAAGVWNVKVGSVQTDGDWLNKAGELANVCDVIGVNIHPFFGASDNSKWNPIEDLKARWNAMTWRFGDKVVLTETGWPTHGTPQNGHVPSMDTALKYVKQVNEWAKGGNGGDAPAHFMFADNPNKGPNFEKAFGLAWSNAAWKFEFSTVGPAPPAPTTPDQGIQGVVFVNKANDKVLAATKDRKVEFHQRWGNDWAVDWSSKWTVRGNLVMFWEAETKTDICLDAPEPWRGGKVHLWPCDVNNRNQQWRYNWATQHLEHATHAGLCLDMKYPEGGAPHTYDCGDFALQKFEWWK
ncbi:Aste57867_9752 [Aphanomyces stellatus]|uniref:glucan endo-1,3-beta-D-glucosidase n=1 Tax=Aphanomyces stellatus TaxID=120398 RepID=A0A485KPB6_9STRA|nr:hypothetical protein As57867_009713 [Aphanomyces stellatus]VFT86631.1 Aste57867_9752 [Aphanomyces stellatus]